MSSATFLIGLTALVACKIAARITVDAARFEDLPHPPRMD